MVFPLLGGQVKPRLTRLRRRQGLLLHLALLLAGLIISMPGAQADSPVSPSATLSSTASSATAASRGVAEDIIDLDHLLAPAKPGQGIVWVGDMGLPVVGLQRYRQELAARQTGLLQPNLAFMPAFTKWSGGNVPYVFDSTVTAADQSAFLDACHDWESVANVHFYHATTEANYIVVHSASVNNSIIGMVGGAQDVNIYNWNFEFIIAHELGHTLGVIHEQSRSDRDAYVTINTANIQTGYADQFAIIPGALGQSSYDFDSVMHYGATDFSRDGSLTISVNQPYTAQWQNAIGQRDHLSDADQAGMASIYGRHQNPTTTALQSSLSRSKVGQSVTLLATVTTSARGVLLAGTVSFADNGIPLGTVSLNKTGQASLTTTAIGVGSRTLTATYNGSTYLLSSQGSLAQIVIPHVSPHYVSPTGDDNNFGTQASPKRTIQAAIDAILSGDTVIVEDGTYSGPGNVDVDFNGKNITVTSANGPTQTIIDCGGYTSSDGSGNHRGFYIHSGETSAVISGFTVKNGVETTLNGYGGNSGGGIFLKNTGSGTLTLTNCIVTANTADYSGGVSNNSGSGTITLTNCIVTANTAGKFTNGGSGGVSNNGSGSGTITLTNCTIAANTAGGSAGGVSNYNNGSGTITLTNCTVTANTADDGGGVVNGGSGSGTITLTNCTIAANTADKFTHGRGGGVANGGGTITLTNCTVMANTAGYGGGVYNGDGTITLTKCTIAANTAGHAGGGVSNNGSGSGTITLTNCTVAANTAGTNGDYGEGGGVNNELLGGRLTLTNCTITANTATLAPSGYRHGQGGGIFNFDDGTSTITLTNCIVYGNTNGELVTGSIATPALTVSRCDIQGGYQGTGNINADPLFVNAAAGGLRLKIGSPCLGAGTPTGAPATDKDSVLRPNPPSIGAYELPVTHVLWTSLSGIASIWNDNPTTGTFTQNTYGPFPGWTAKAIADGPDGKTRVLWTNTNGQMSLWNLDNSTGIHNHFEYGPYAGSSAVALSVAANNTTHLLWTNTDGTASIWDYNAATGTFTQNTYGPFPGWTAKAIADGPDGKTRVLWTNTNGQMSLWNLDNSTGVYNHFEYGAYPGWTAIGVSVGTDNITHVLWSSSSGQASIWNENPMTGTFTLNIYGPFPGWTAKAIADGADGKTRVLWTNTNGQMSLWNLDNSTGVYNHFEYGAYPGWTASMLSGSE